MGIFGRKRDGGEKTTAARGEKTTAGGGKTAGDEGTGFLPRRSGRRGVESLFVRLVATGGIVGIATGLAAILGSQEVAYWIVGIVVAGVSVILAAVLWSSKVL